MRGINIHRYKNGDIVFPVRLCSFCLIRFLHGDDLLVSNIVIESDIYL